MAGTEGWSRILHRKDERGVIVESQVFGPDDEVPEGFGETDYQPIHAPREDEHAPVEESRLAEWENPMKPSLVIEDVPEQAAESLAAEAGESGEDDEAEVSEGTPRQAREQAGEDLTEAEQEALEQAVSDATGDLVKQSEDEVDEGSPRQAREQSEDGELIEAEEEADEALSSGDDAVQPPPQGGVGSGKEAWAQYAAAKNVSVSEGAGRDEIIAAVKKAGHPVD